MVAENFTAHPWAYACELMLAAVTVYDSVPPLSDAVAPSTMAVPLGEYNENVTAETVGALPPCSMSTVTVVSWLLVMSVGPVHRAEYGVPSATD